MLRFFHMLNSFSQHGLNALGGSHPGSLLLRGVLVLLFPWRLLRSHPAPLPERVRLFLEAQGPLGIKLGQLLSTRVDLLPEPYLASLRHLQDQVTPLSWSQLVRAHREPLSHELSDRNEHPLAAASLAQIHQARLRRTQEPVVIKCLRPGTRQRIGSDLRLLRRMLALSAWFFSVKFMKQSQSLVDELAYSLHNEMDLQQEAANLNYMHRFITEEHPKARVPHVFWSESTPFMLVMEELQGIPLNASERLKAAGFNSQHLAHCLIDVFLEQLLHFNFFHADLHPGNIMVLGSPAQMKLGLMDFGMVGSLSSSDQRYIALNLLAFTQRDYARIASLHKASGWVPAHIRTDQLEAALRKVSEPVWGKSLNRVSMSETLQGLINLAHDFDLKLQPQLLLLQKALVTLEGTCRMLDPKIDVWAQAAPALQAWQHKQKNWKTSVKALKRYGFQWLEQRMTQKDDEPSQPPPPPANRKTHAVLLICTVALLISQHFSGSSFF